MTLSINPVKSQIRHYQMISAGLILAVDHSLERLIRSHYQLEQIAKEDTDESIQKEAAKFCKRNTKLIAIAHELIERMQKFSKSDDLDPDLVAQGEMVAQFKQEIDILDYMHFEIAKNYYSFIHNHYETQVIRLIPFSPVAA